VGDKLSLRELAEPRLDLLAEPCVMVKIMLYELPNVFFRAAIIFRRDVGEFRLELGAKIYFQVRSLGSEIATIKCP
jgi:hypothetical protein